MSQALFLRATAILKKVMPLMIRYRIPPTPLHYALWYTYIAQENAVLSKEIDAAIDNNGTITELQSEDLYQREIADKQQAELRELRYNLQTMVQHFSSSVQDVISDTVGFQTQMQKWFNELDTIEKEGFSVEDMSSFVKAMLTESQQLRSNTTLFHSQLSQAQREINVLRHQLDKAQHDALYDGLTGVFNRRALDIQLDSYLDDPALSRLAFVICDIDHFKQLNDSFGHFVGDMVLKAVAKRINEHCQSYGTVYRYGGEEFVLLIPNQRFLAVRERIEDLRVSLSRLQLKDRRTGRMVNGITLSFGMALKQENDDAQGLISRADVQLYEAKRLGRNRVMPVKAPRDDS